MSTTFYSIIHMAMYIFRKIKNCNSKNCRAWIFANQWLYTLSVAWHMRDACHIWHTNLHLSEVVQVCNTHSAFDLSLERTSIPKKGRNGRAKEQKRGDIKRLRGERPIVTNWVHFSKGGDKHSKPASTSLRHLSAIDSDKR